MSQFDLAFPVAKVVLQYMYSGEYGMYTSVPEERLRLHAEVYAAAEKLRLEGLMNLAMLKKEVAYRAM
jgi:uncharacterized pyridoxal phosphate-containing UPF0001 family protein